jgi:hypothetical protein
MKPGEQLPFPYPDAEPVIFKEDPEADLRRGNDPDAQRAEVDRLVVRNEAERAQIRERRKKRKGKERHRDERLMSELETERWERVDRRVERYVFLATFSLGALATIALAFITYDSANAALQVSPGAPATVSILAGLRLRALTRGDRTSIWDWLIQRDQGG